jgi:hypothetical protein
LRSATCFFATGKHEFDIRAYVWEGDGMAKKNTLTAFAKRACISVPYASQLRSGTAKPPSVERAADIYRRTGEKFGIFAVADNREANMIVRVLERAGALVEA